MTSRESLFKAAWYSLPPIVAILVTWLTGFLQPYSLNTWGFPLVWRVLACVFCPAMVSAFDTRVNWLGFGLDVLVYAAMGYGIVLASGRHHFGLEQGRQRPRHAVLNIESRESRLRK